VRSGNFKGALPLALITSALLILEISLFSAYSLSLASALPSYPVVSPETGENYYWFRTCSLLVNFPAVPIMCGTETGYNIDLTQREPIPALYYLKEFPPIGATELVDNGRVIALGGLGILQSTPVNEFDDTRLAAGKLMPLIVRWLIGWGDPREHKFLFYYTSGAFNNASNLSSWLNTLENWLGFELDTREGGAITPELLKSYDVIQVVAENQISDSEVQAIAGWVENGGALLLMEQSDYGGYSNVMASNKILETIGCDIRFQDDEVHDDNHWTKDGPWFPQVYLIDTREANPKFDMWFPFGASVSILPTNQSGSPGAMLTYTVTVTNTGNVLDNYTLTVSDNASWSPSISPTMLTVPPLENRTATLIVPVPSDAIGGTIDKVTVTVTSQTDNAIVDVATCTATAEAGGTSPLIYVGAAVIIVVIIAAVLIIKPF